MIPQKTFCYLTEKAAMLIQQEETGRNGSFVVNEGQERVAEMTYSLDDPNVMIIEHTAVAEVRRGNNLGYKMLQQAADYARQKKLSIIPQCSFAVAVFEKQPGEFADVKKNEIRTDRGYRA